MSNIPDDLLDLVEELVIIEEERKRKDREKEDARERLYEELPLPEQSDKQKIKIFLE